MRVVISFLKASLVVAILFAANFFEVQSNGGEDARMYNNAKARDQQAIDEAVNGWWKHQ
jgi:alpha-L-fucosidase